MVDVRTIAAIAYLFNEAAQGGASECDVAVVRSVL
jgi:hypothetical protein